MVARITTAAFQGIDVQPVDVQVQAQAHIASSLPDGCEVSGRVMINI